MKNLSIHWWAGVIFLVLCGFSLIDGSLVADPPTILLAAMAGAGMLVCEVSMPDRRRRRQAAPGCVVGNSRN